MRGLFPSAREWRRGVGDTRPGGEGRPDVVRRRDANDERADHRPPCPQDPPEPADPLHLRLCGRTIEEFDRPRTRFLPRQALLRAEAGRSGPRHAAGEIIFWIFSQQALRSEEHTSELQSLMRISYAVFCLKKQKTKTTKTTGL